VVKPGDTLIGLGRAYLTKSRRLSAVQKANQIARNRASAVGSRLNIDPNLLKSTPIDARYRRSAARSRSRPRPARIPARIGMPLAKASRDHRSRRLRHLRDGGRLARHPAVQHRVRITKLRQTILNNAPQRVFQLDQGRGTISATPTQNPTPGSRCAPRVDLGRARHRVPGRADGDPNGGRAQTEVLKGAVGVDPGGRSDLAARRCPPASASAPRPPASARRSSCCPRPSWATGGQSQGDKTVHFAVSP
jgi:hypothetical protein